MNFHPILLLLDEDRFAGKAKSTRRAQVRIDAVRDYAVWLADRVAARGIRGCEAEVQRLARAARRHGVRSVALDVLAEPAEPAIDRERALGLVITAIFQLRDEPATYDAA